jgi:hypothetical protein
VDEPKVTHALLTARMGQCFQTKRQSLSCHKSATSKMVAPATGVVVRKSRFRQDAAVDFTRKLWPGCAATAVCTVMALSPCRALAAEVATRLDYSATPGCPGAEDFAAAVTGRLGYRPFRKDASERVVVRIEPEGKGLEGRLEWRDAAGGWLGEQTLPSRTGNCPELVHAMGFALAVQFQLMATAAARSNLEPPASLPGRAQPSSPAPGGFVSAPSVPSASVAASPLADAATSVSPALPTSTPQPAAPAPPEPGESLPATVTRDAPVTSPSSASSGPSLTLGAGAAVALGAAPSLVALGRLFGAVGWTHVAIELAGEISPESSSTRREDGAGFTHQQVLGSLAGCGLVQSWGACLVAKAGEIRVTGRGVDVPATATGLLMQFGVRLTWTHMLGRRFEIGAHADGLALATDGKVTLDALPVWTTPRFTASLGLDVGVRFR